jgi:hypothetical protein
LVHFEFHYGVVLASVQALPLAVGFAFGDGFAG